MRAEPPPKRKEAVPGCAGGSLSPGPDQQLTLGPQPGLEVGVPVQSCSFPHTMHPGLARPCPAHKRQSWRGSLPWKSARGWSASLLPACDVSARGQCRDAAGAVPTKPMLQATATCLGRARCGSGCQVVAAGDSAGCLPLPYSCQEALLLRAPPSHQGTACSSSFVGPGLWTAGPLKGGLPCFQGPGLGGRFPLKNLALGPCPRERRPRCLVCVSYKGFYYGEVFIQHPVHSSVMLNTLVLHHWHCRPS